MKTYLTAVRNQLTEPAYSGLLRSIQKRVQSGKLSPDADLLSAIDSLEWVDLEMEMEELGIEITVPIRTVEDLIWLLRAIEFQANRKRAKRMGQL